MAIGRHTFKPSRNTSPSSSVYKFFDPDNVSPQRLRKALGDFRKQKFKQDYIFNFMTTAGDNQLKAFEADSASPKASRAELNPSTNRIFLKRPSAQIMIGDTSTQKLNEDVIITQNSALNLKDQQPTVSLPKHTSRKPSVTIPK